MSSPAPSANPISRRELFTGSTAAASPAMHRPDREPARASGIAANLPEQILATPPGPARWLTKASYGYSAAAKASFDALTGSGDDAKWTSWVNQQLAPASISDADCNNRIAAAGFVTLGKPLTQLWTDHVLADPEYYVRLLPTSETECATLIRAVYSRRQLFERVTNFWHDHFSVLGWDYDIAPIFASYDRDVIRPHALGNFRVMLEAVAKSTAMQIFLDNYASRGAEFNENYARELLELHTLGVSSYYGPTDPFNVPCLGPALRTDVHCEGTMPAGYVDNDVYEAAAALTGWSIKNGYWQYPTQNDGSFVYRPEWHDRRNKIFIGHYLPPNQGAMQDGEDVFDRLVAHPATARHIASKLCRRFVGDAPTSALIDEVAAVFTAEVAAPDQIARMLRVILLSNEFKTSWGGGMRRPYEVMASAMRGLGTDFTPRPDNTSSWTTTERMVSYLSQAGHRSFNWAPPNGYPDRQTAWASTGALAMSLRLLAWLPEMKVVYGATPEVFCADIVAQTRAQFPSASTRTAAALIGWWCDRLHGYRPEPLYGVVTAFLQQNATAGEAINIDTDAWASTNLKAHYSQQRLRTAVGMLLMGPDYFRR